MDMLDVAWTPVAGVWVRQSAAGSGGLGDVAGPSRWQAGGRRTVYLADDEETAWAELYGALAERREAPRWRCHASSTVSK